MLSLMTIALPGELPDIRGAALDQAQSAEAAEALRVDPGEGDRGLGKLGALVEGRDRLVEERQEALDVLIAGKLRLEHRDGGLRRVVGLGGVVGVLTLEVDGEVERLVS